MLSILFLIAENHRNNKRLKDTGDDSQKVGSGILESQSDPDRRAKDCDITGEDTKANIRK